MIFLTTCTSPSSHAPSIPPLVPPPNTHTHTHTQQHTLPLPAPPQSQLRAQLLTQLQRGQILKLGPPPGDKPSLRRRALNSMIADYLAEVRYAYSLSVFREESGLDAGTDKWAPQIHI